MKGVCKGVVDVIIRNFLSKITMARQKICMILDKTRTNAWLDSMMGNNSEQKKTNSDWLNLALVYF